MPDPIKPGRTLWEMLMDRVHRSSNGQAALVTFRNPNDLRIGSPVKIAYANGPDWADFDFTVQEIREYVRRIGGQEFGFTDYVLRGINRKTFDADQAQTLRLRVVPNAAGAYDSLLLHLYDEFGFAEDFLAVVKDDTGQFTTTDDDTGVTDTYTRINDLREAYEAAVLLVTKTNAEGQALPGTTSAVKLEYWDYWRDVDIGDGKSAREFLFVEMNSDTGWIQIWRGREFFS